MRFPVMRSCVGLFLLLLARQALAQVPTDPNKLPSLEQVKAELTKPQLTEMTTQRDVEAFCEARVLKMPAADAPERQSPAAWTKYMESLREKTLSDVVFRGEAAKWRDYQGKVEWQETIEGGEGYSIRKLRYEAVPGLWIPALLYVPAKLEGKVPVFLNVNGHDGGGKAARYKQLRCINLAKRGILAMNLEWVGMGQLRGPGFAHYKVNQIDLCGTSGVAVHFLAMKRGLDVLLAQAGADPTRVGIAGLSGGGWQTIFFSSLEPRITLSNPVAGYSSFFTRIQHYSDLGDSEQTPVDLAATADYAHLTAMLAPRVALLTFNEKDNCCFAAPHALPPLMEAARPAFQLFGKPEHLHQHINYDPGNHNFERDNREALYKVIGQHWFAGDEQFATSEIASDSELKTAEQLAVELPAENLDFQQLATALMKGLPRGKATPQDLAAVLRLPKQASASIEASEQSPLESVLVKRTTLRVNRSWMVPLIEFRKPGVKRTVLLLADEGKASVAERAHQAIAEGWNVAAIDPFYFGEAKIKNKSFLFALLVSSVGERPLGVQASEVQIVAGMLSNNRRDQEELRVVAIGPRASLIALAATAADVAKVNGPSIDSLELHGSLGSLKEVIEQGGSVDKTPEQFCFGLLETADIRQLAELVVPRPVKFVEPSERATRELAELKAAYRQAGREFDPLAP
jgi:hypothetical protein